MQHNPRPAIIDSPSVKSTDRGGEHGYDGGKQVNGRKRHLLVDTLGLVLKVKLHAANLAERDGAYLLLTPLQGVFSRLRHLWADMGYRGQVVGWIHTHLGWRVEIVMRPRRWDPESASLPGHRSTNMGEMFERPSFNQPKL